MGLHVKKQICKSIFILLIFCMQMVPLRAQGSSGEQPLLQIKIYHFESAQQEQAVDRYLREAYIPALHRAGIEPVGVFKPLGQDTTSDRRTYVLLPFDSFERFRSLSEILQNDRRHQTGGADYIETSHSNPAYSYIESILLEAFSHAPRVRVPDLEAPRSERVYELRSYGSATEALNRNKVEMFNEGGEVALFRRLGFNAVFYGNVLSGGEMPNLMYMTSFENMESRDAHWETFVDDPEWKELSSMEKYQNNVSRISIQFLRSADYSDI